MIPYFNNLTAEETRAMVDAIPLITILIAGAHSNIDRREKTWALKLSRIRTYSNPEDLHEYYHYVGASFGDMLNNYIDKLPKKVPHVERCGRGKPQPRHRGAKGRGV
ncbi:MAG: hypothetical protein AAF573_21210, partial [Bacteroidota bacterium]